MKARALVGGRRAKDLPEVLAEDVDRAGDEGRVGAERQRERVEGTIERAERRRFRLLELLATSASTAPS